MTSPIPGVTAAMTPPACRLCGAEAAAQDVRAPVVYGSTEGHRFFQCRACDLVYLWPVPSEAQERQFYTNEFERYMHGRTKDGRDWSGPELHKRSNQDHVTRRLRFLEGHWKPGDRILEVGCSSGFMMDAFRDAGMDPVGIEMSESFIAYLRSNQHACFGSMDELRVMRPSHRFDLIVHFFVLEHIRDTRQFLADQLAVLADDGVIIAEVPCVNDPLTSLYAIPAFERFYWSIAHHYYFSPRSIARVLDTIDCQYAIVPEQRYDLSNHLVWMQHGQPGGQGRYNDVFSSATLESYRQDLMRHWRCDTFFLYVWKRGATHQASRVWDSPAVCGQGAAPQTPPPHRMTGAS